MKASPKPESNQWPIDYNCVCNIYSQSLYQLSYRRIHELFEKISAPYQIRTDDPPVNSRMP